MTKEQKEMKRYMTAIERRLDLPREVKVRVMRDLQSSVQERREAGQTDNEIYAEMGTPKAVAAELNEQMKEYAYGKSKWRWAALAAAAVAGVMLLIKGVVGLLLLLLDLSMKPSAEIGIIGGADGPTAILIAGPIINLTGILLAITIIAVIIALLFLSKLLKKKK